MLPIESAEAALERLFGKAENRVNFLRGRVVVVGHDSAELLQPIPDDASLDLDLGREPRGFAAPLSRESPNLPLDGRDSSSQSGRPLYRVFYAAGGGRWMSLFGI